MKMMRSFIFAALALASGVCSADPQGPLYSAADFFKAETTTDRVRLQGMVSDAFMDDVDPNFMYLILTCENESIPVSVMFREEDLTKLLDTIGRQVEVMGNIRTTSAIVSRAYLGRMLCVGSSNDIEVLGPGSDRFEAPWLDLPEFVLPSELSELGDRRVAGRVLAVWGGTEALLEAPEQRPVRLSFPEGSKLPSYGAEIEAVGQVETDTFNINLTRAAWRSVSDTNEFEREIKTLTFPQLITSNRNGTPCFRPQYNGATVRLTGVVRGISGLEHGKFQIENGVHHIMVDASALPGSVAEIERGCTVEITGTCVLDTEKWHPTDIFPRVRGLLIIPNLPEDIRITARAPWLTPARTWSLLMILLGATCAFMVWNRILWHRAYRQGKELSAETLARAEADMRTQERTRLAVELHDSLVQSLAGVIMELETARRTVPEADSPYGPHLDRAERMLRSCHTDLRNCLWDLRNDALGEQEMKSAIERTLIPHVKDVSLDIRFSVARVMLADNTAYMILRAIRELVLNGIKHGGAKHIKIAGAIEDGKLLISVRDDGKGFDPDLAPGVMDGHFGLEGIRERLRNLSGTFEITSTPGNGTRAVLTIPANKGEKQA